MEGFEPRNQLKKVFSTITAQNFFGENVDKRMIDGKSALTYLFELFEETQKVSRHPLIWLPVSDSMKRKIIGPYRRFVEGSRRLKALLQEIIEEERKNLETNPDLKGRNMIEGLIEAQTLHKDRPHQCA